MNILVTGGAGFIGSHLCEKILKNGNFVLCLDNFNDFYDPEIKWKNIKNLQKNENFKLIVGDINSVETLEDIFKKNKIDIIFHLAARAGVRPSLREPHLYSKVNIDGTINILESMKNFRVKNMVFASSSSVYGKNTDVPFSEEKTHPLPISTYGATKIAGELLCHAYGDLYGLNITCLRYFTVYGPRQRPEMAIHKFVANIINEKEISVYGDGESKRDYTYIDDVVEGTILASMKLKDFNVYNIGSSNPVSLNELVAEISKQIGKKPLIKKIEMQLGDMLITYANIKKAEKELGYSPKIKITEGIKKMCDWYLKEKNL